jgi:hypothetical protein
VQLDFHSSFYLSITWSLPVVALMLLPFAGGCERQPTTVTGAITVDHAPPKITGDTRGTISFQPAAGQGVNATGLLGPTGMYQLSAGRSSEIPPGRYQVAISIVKLLPKSDNGENGAKQIIATKYDSTKTSGLAVEVHPGPNEFDFDVSPSDEAHETTPDTLSPTGSLGDKRLETLKNVKP